MRNSLLALTLLATALGAIAGAQEAPADPRKLQPDHAPTPFSADQIRAGCPAGRVFVLRMEQAGSPAPVDQVFRFLTNTAEGAKFSVTITDLKGTPLKISQNAQSSWKAFQSHASFPEANTRIEKGRVETPVGAFDCMVYIVKQKTPKGDVESRFWFANRLPGPPVKMITFREGKQVSSMLLVRHRDGNEAELIKQMSAGRPAKPTQEDAKPTKKEMATTVFGAIATKGSKTIDKKRFVAASGIKDAKAARRAFAWFDRNGDGSVTPTEFAKTWRDWS